MAREATRTSARLADAGLLIKCIAALVRDVGTPRIGPDIPLCTSPDEFPFADCDLIVEVLGGVEPARTLVERALRLGIPVVTANKSLVAAHGLALQALARRHRTSLYFEAAVMAGVPCVNTLARRPLASGADVYAGILNGTSHFILSRIAKGETFDAALVDAVERGYAEPSSDADISGRDAAEKLTILLHLAGYRDVVVADLPTRGIADIAPWHAALAARLSGVIKPVACARTVGETAGAWVGPAFVPTSHAFASLTGVDNILRVGSGDQAVTFSGPGAGRAITAATIIDDVVEVVSGRHLIAQPPVARQSASGLRTVPTGAWFLALDNVASSAGDLAEFLAARHLPAVFLAQDHDRCAVITATAPATVLAAVVEALTATGVRVLWLPVVADAEVSHA